MQPRVKSDLGNPSVKTPFTGNSRLCQDKIRTGPKPALQLLRHETMARGYMGINAARVERLHWCPLVQSLKVHIPESLTPVLSQHFQAI